MEETTINSWIHLYSFLYSCVKYTIIDSKHSHMFLFYTLVKPSIPKRKYSRVTHFYRFLHALIYSYLLISTLRHDPLTLSHAPASMKDSGSEWYAILNAK